MVKCNLDSILKDRKIRITKLSDDTGISRTTITSLCKGYAKGITFDVMGKLCEYLGVGFDELFVSENNKLEKVIYTLNKDSIDVSYSLGNKNKVASIPLSSEDVEITFSIDSIENSFSFTKRKGRGIECQL